MEGATLGKLNLSDQFYGREFELQQLKDAYNRLHGSELVVVCGYAGAGKSALVRNFASSIDGYFLTGKADELIVDPFWSIIEAFSQWLQKIVAEGEESERERLKLSILAAVGDEGKVLTDLIPGLAALIGEQPESTLDPTKSSALRRLHHLVAEFVRAICTEERPVVLFLDDVQWADAATLDLLTTLATDPRLHHFMLIGSYRDNEVDPNHALFKALERIRKRGRAYVTLNLGNLSLENVQTLVADTLSTDVDQTTALAEVLFKKTSGNAFYTKASLQVLENKELLKYNYGSMRWDYDLLRIEQEMGLSENVVDMVVSRLERLPEEVQLVLSTAAFLRSTFTLKILKKLLIARERQEIAENVVKYLDVAVTEGLLENMMGSPSYRFVHDRIQSAAISLVAQDERDILNCVIGRALVDMAGFDQSLLFIGVDRLNATPLRLVVDALPLVDLAELNLQAGERSIAISAFAPASGYLQRGVELLELDSERWEVRYDLCLRLYSAAADVEFCIGTFDRAKYLADEVLTNAIRFDDRLPAYMSLSEGLGQREKHFDAMDIDTKILLHYGELPKRTNPVSALWEVAQLKKVLNKMSDEEIIGLPMMMNPDKLNSIAVLSNLGLRSFYCKKLMLSLCCVLRQVRLTLDHGLSGTGAYAFSGFGVMLWGHLNDEPLGRRMIRLSIEIMKMTNAKEYEAKILFNACNYVNPWVQPLTKVMEDCNAGYRSGMESGDVEFGFFGFGLYSLISFITGLPLETTYADLTVFLRLTRQYNVEAVYNILSPLEELVAALIGKGMDLSQIREEASRMPKDSVRDPSQTLRLADRYTAFLQLAFYFGDYQLADEMWHQSCIFGQSNPSFYSITTGCLYSLLIATACYRETRKSKYKARAKAALAQMNKMMKTKGVNLTHKMLLMQAEFEATFARKKRVPDIKECFDRAIAAATKGGIMHESAIANELAGQFFLRSGDDFWVTHYLTRAYTLFSSWGASAKAEQLLENYGTNIEKSRDNARMSTTRKARDVMASCAVEMHSTIDTERSTTDCVTFSGGSSHFFESSSSGNFGLPGKETLRSSPWKSGHNKAVHFETGSGTFSLSGSATSSPLDGQASSVRKTFGSGESVSDRTSTSATDSFSSQLGSLLQLQPRSVGAN